jgi:4-hydroxybenzoate polyprenyltransferase
VWFRCVCLTILSILLGASSLSLVVIYPAMKRVTHWPQAVLGWFPGFFRGDISNCPSPHRTCIQLGVSSWMVGGHRLRQLDCLSATIRRWNLLDTCLRQYIRSSSRFHSRTKVYEINVVPSQDKVDDIHAGIRSTALLFGTHTRPILSGLSLSTLSLVSYAGYLNAQGAPFYLGISLATVQLARVLYRTDFDERSSCWKGFVGCGWAGFWIWMGALGDYALLMSGQQNL